ncbi:MAG: hypothetical protein K9I85_11035 [Saprospiraceae bacterium]|nr:hypothetical protein [Saprospiraceae bacterium]
MSQEQQKKDWQKKLSEREAPLDVQQFWNNLEPQLPLQKKRRGIAWWIWPAALLIGIGMATAFYLSDGQIAIHEGESLRTEKNIQETNPIVEHAPEHQEIHTELSTIGNERHGEVFNSDQEEAKNVISAPAQEAIPVRTHARSTGHTQTNHDQLRVKKTVGRNSVAENIQDKPQDQGVSSLITNKVTEEMKMNGDIHGSESEVALLSQNTIDLLDIQPVSYAPDFVEMNPQPGPQAWTWAIGLAAGPGVGFRQLTSSGPANASWISQRNQEESVLESWQIRGMVEVVHPNGWLLEIGLQWTHQNERLDWSRDSMNWAWGLGEGFLVDPNGGTQPWADSTWSFYSLTRTVRHYNRISTLEIPVGVGYQISRGRWSARASVGALINLRQSASGRSIHPGQWPVYWGETFGPNLKTSLGIGAYGHVQLSYQFQNRLHGFIQPSFTFYPDDRQEGNTYSLKYNQANLLVGLRWNLN